MTRPILVVDDDPSIRDVITFALAKAGHETAVAVDGPSALDQVAELRPRLIVLDVGMPGLDGLSVCREVRKTSDVPILFLSASDEEIDRVLGLEIGGDDYVTKPFSPRELVARVGIILRRSEAALPPTQTLERGGLVLDADRHTTAFAGQPVALTAVEFGLLRTLVQRPGVVFTREQLMESAYGGRIHVSDRTVDSHVRNIRAKLAEAGCRTGVETVHSIGFRLGSCQP